MKRSLATSLSLAIGIAGLLVGNYALRGPSRPNEITRRDPSLVPQQPTDAFEKRRQARERIVNASDYDLKSLVQECRAKIEDDIRKTRQPFTAYFPSYNESDLEGVYAASSAFRTPMGRPSGILEGRDILADNVRKLREYPTLPISFVVESASDSFSGVKRWAAVYNCDVDGLQISRVGRGNRYFFD